MISRWMAALACVMLASALSPSAQPRAQEQREAGLQWRCDAFQVFRVLCHEARDAVEEQRISPTVELPLFQGSPVTVLTESAGTRIIFDFGERPGGELVRERLKGEHVADLLLMADSVLPPHVEAITLKNVVVEGPLELEQVSFSRALTLDSICLGVDDCEALSKSADAEQACADHENDLFLYSVSFEKALVFRDLSGCGSLYVIGSKLQGGLLITAQEESLLFGDIVVNKSTVSPELFVHHMALERLSIAFDDIEVAQVRNSRFYKLLEVRDSSIASFTSFSNVIDTPASSARTGKRSVDFNANSFEGSLNLTQLVIGETADIYLGDNRVGGRLALGLVASLPTLGMDSVSRGQVALQLHGNDIEGAADIFIGKGVAADIELRGSRVRTDLVLTRAIFDEDEDELRALAPDVGMPDSPVISVDFTGSEVGTLVWNLPTDANAPFTWQGGGLRYDFWDPEPKSGTRPYAPAPEVTRDIEVAQALQEWTEKLEAPPGAEIDPLTYAADYLQAHGYVAEQAAVRRRALQANFGNRVLSKWTHYLWPLVIASVLLPVWHWRGAIRTKAARLWAFIGNWWRSLTPRRVIVVATPVILLTILIFNASLVGNMLFFVALLPVGWGAHPEWALLSMALASILCWLVYVNHSEKLRKEGWEDRLRLESGLRISIAKDQLLDLRNFLWTKPAEAPEQERTNPPGIQEEGGIYEPLAADAGRSFASGSRLSLPISLGQAPGHVAEAPAPEDDPPCYSRVPGFNQYDSTFPPRSFYLFLYSLDTMLPVINLHHFNRYYPYDEGTPWVRWLSIAQHGVGWWLSTIFIASLVI